MAFRRTEIGLPFGKLYFLRHSLEFSFTDGRQIFPVRRRCGFLVKEDRQIITFCHFRAHFFGKRNGFFHGYIPDRNKGNHVHSSHTGMLALMPVYLLQITSLTEIGDTFYDFIHNPFKLRMMNEELGCAKQMRRKVILHS